MAKIAATMASTGAAHEQCNGCGKQFERGEQMAAVEYADGQPAGWFCDNCIDTWKTTGTPPGTEGD